MGWEQWGDCQESVEKPQCNKVILNKFMFYYCKLVFLYLLT
jgi:hypothetical protein